MVNVLICGALGKMGKKVYQACVDNPNANPLCGVDIIQNNDVKDFPIFASFNDVNVKPDVIIDFSSPKTLESLLAYATANAIPCVLCSTGYSKEQLEEISLASQKIAIFRSANMSLGVNVLIELVKKCAQTLYGYDIEVIEKHHNQKVDAPSGTALMLADAVKEVCPEKFYVYGREGKPGKRNPDEIGIHAVRAGTIVGEHDVLFSGVDETITLSHQATDRQVFAQGAVSASIFIADKKFGSFNMTDLINQK